MRSIIVAMLLLMPFMQVLGQAGKYAPVNGINMYYEIHGSGKPLLLIHPNSGSTEGMKNQLEYFKGRRMVIMADSRGQGRSSYTGKELFSYDLLASDWAALLDQLGVNDVDVFGWSDGAIIALLLAKDHAKRIDKVYAFGANTLPIKESVVPPLAKGITLMAPRLMPPARMVTQMMVDHPNLQWSSLWKIKRPVTIATADHDMVLLEHSVKIFRSMPNAYLEVFSNANHFLPMLDPQRINVAMDTFFSKPFDKPSYILPGMELMWVE